MTVPIFQGDAVKHVHYDEVESKQAKEAGAEGVEVRWLISEDDGAPHFYMRRFELVPGGRTPRHTHPWEHEVYILEGEGTLYCEGAERPFRPHDVVYIAAQEEHCFLADRGIPVAFLCLIPRRDD